MRAVLLFAVMVPVCGAQVIEVENVFRPTPLTGVWKHHGGDDPRWADPAFDDSAWRSVRMPEGAMQLETGPCWFRLRIRLPDNRPEEPLALLIGAFGDSQAYEVFWNGRRAGAVGAHDRDVAGQMIGAPQTIPVVVDGREAVVAIRLRTKFTPLRSISDPAHRTSWLGTKDAVGDRWQTLRGERLRTVLPLLLMAASLLLSSLLFLLLPLWRRDAPEYFWFGLWLLSANGVRVLQAYPDIVGLESSQAAIWGLALVGSGLIVGWFGWMRSLFAGRMTKALWFSLVVCLATVSGAVLRFNPGAVTPLSNFASLMLLTVLQAFAYFQLGWRTSRGRDRMPAVHLAILAYFAVNSASYTAAFLWQSEAVAIQGSLARTVSLLLFAFAMTILMNQRSARLVAERQRLSGELASAAEVQSLLLGSMPAAGDAYQIEPFYLPASEVGGDFYRIFPTGDGAILVVVGDVSGKGLRAAMTVSGLTCAMAVIRTRRPGAFLAELNRAAAAHLQSGFATCCAALIQLDGEAIIANAGHLAPYCDGKELVLEGGLPLGIAAEGEYPETIVRGERFTFVSDGVVEAENAQRELFGFDRTREISTQSAQEIAEAAKAWGQNDDITVVTVRRSGA
jgi:sigma-B regulation protein RsbU (phosphoserine phosphatase)